MSFKADNKPKFLSFILLTLVLAAGIFAGASLERFPAASNFWWLLPVGLLSFALSFFLSRFSSWYLFLALPLAAMVAYSASDRIWPKPQDNIVVTTMPPAENLDKTPLKVYEETGPKSLENKELYVSQGLNVSIFAAKLVSPRMLAVSPDGVLFASIPKTGKVVALPDLNRDGIADSVEIFADNLHQPHGLAFFGKTLYVAETNGLLRLFDDNNDLIADRREKVSDDIPSGGGHWTRTLVIDQNEQLYVSVGSSCNNCLEEDVRRATVLRFSPQGGDGEIFAYGLRNSVGLAWHPETGHLWGSDNGRDMLGDNLPPDEINQIVQSGDYGWPYCYGDKIPDPELGTSERCRNTRESAVDIQAHSAPLGICFGRGLKASTELQNSLYVALHGSWNRTVPTGYKLIRIPFSNGQPSGPAEDLVTGWLAGSSAWGRPVAPVVGADGALYLSDDKAGVIYRITFPPQEALSQ